MISIKERRQRTINRTHRRNIKKFLKEVMTTGSGIKDLQRSLSRAPGSVMHRNTKARILSSAMRRHNVLESKV